MRPKIKPRNRKPRLASTGTQGTDSEASDMEHDENAKQDETVGAKEVDLQI